MRRLFGTDGVRGIANLELTPELAFRLGKAGGYVLGKQGKDRPVFLIGMDTRISGDLLENAITSGILAVGGDVIKVGVLPTPAVAYLVKKYNADAGVVISASHNPYEYNGIKFFNKDGFKLDDDIEDEIEGLILSQIDAAQHLTHDKMGVVREAEESAVHQYLDYLLDIADFSLEGKKIVLDCANGAAYEVAPKLYEKLGCKVVVLGDKPNGININLDCGSTHPQILQEKVVEEGAFLGLAFDGDADRLIAVDEKGNIIDGDKLICICAAMMKEEARLGNDIVTGTLMSNIGFHKYLEDIGCSTRSTNVGDRYVLEDMLKTGSKVGGEQSGHMIFLEYSTTGDGILSSLQVVRAILKSGKEASQLSEEIKIYPQVLVNAKVNNLNKNKYEKDKDIIALVKEIEESLKDRGRILVRPSGTEPLVRVMIEGDDIEEIKQMANKAAELITRKLG